MYWATVLENGCYTTRLYAYYVLVKVKGIQTWSHEIYSWSDHHVYSWGPLWLTSHSFLCRATKYVSLSAGSFLVRFNPCRRHKSSHFSCKRKYQEGAQGERGGRRGKSLWWREKVELIYHLKLFWQEPRTHTLNYPTRQQDNRDSLSQQVEMSLSAWMKECSGQLFKLRALESRELRRRHRLDTRCSVLVCWSLKPEMYRF